MEFDKVRVYSAHNADEVKIGSKGFVADTLFDLKKDVFLGDAENIETVVYINDDTCERRFRDKDACEWHLFYLLEEPKEELCTYRELTKWLAQGNGEESFDCDSGVYTNAMYIKSEADKGIDEKILVRKWDDEEWHRPTKEYMGIK